jgi:hypothetical protein
VAKTSSTFSSKTIVSVPPAPSSYDRSAFETAIAAIIATQSTRLEKSIDAIEKTESFPPAEILSVIDYNRTYDLSAIGKIEKNSYGSYYDSLESIHSITCEDVSYIATKCLENDATGAWTSLENSVNTDVEDAKSLINFLSTYFLAVERAQESLNFTRKNDENLQSFGESFLKSRTTIYGTRPENRVFSTENILNESFESNAEALKKMLEVLKNNLTKENETTYQAIINSLSLKTVRDLNLVEDHWNAIDSLGDSNAERLAACSEIISHIFSLSVGLQKFNNSNLLSKVSNKNDLGSIFDGTNLTSRPGRTSGPDPFPYRRNVINENSDLSALSLLQYDSSEGDIIVPVENEGAPDGHSYLSGRDALIKLPILNGEFSFAEFKRFCEIFEKNRSNIEFYLELFLGQCDPVNEITPFEIFKIICKNFLDGLVYADDNDRAKLTLFLLKYAASSVADRQNIVRAVEILKTNQVDVGTSTTDTIETTTTTSTEGEEISEKSDATTTRVEIKRYEKTKRIIEKYASNINKDDLLKNFLGSIVSNAPGIKGDDATTLSLIYNDLGSSLNTDSKTFFNFILNSYDEIVKSSVNMLPEDQEIVNKSGTTLYSNFDEFGLLVLIVECFANLASGMTGLQPTPSGVLGYTINDEVISGSTSLSGVKESLRDFLNQLQVSEFMNISSDSSYMRSILIAFSTLLNKQEKYQNSQAYLAAFSDEMRRSRDNLVKSSNDMLNNSTNGRTLNNQEGREVLANLSLQQIACRRSSFEKYLPESGSGYLPRRTTYSVIESKVLDTLLSSTTFSSSTSENFRIVVCAAPILSIDNKVERDDDGIASASGEKNQTGVLDLVIFRKDHEFDDLIFKPKAYLLDPLLYVGPSAFNNITSDDVITGDDIVLEICKRSIFSLHDLDDTRYLTYADALDDERYTYLSQSEIEEILKNTMLSYLLESYIYKLSGAIFDECVNIELDSSISDTGLSAISTASNLKLPDLVLPTTSQINSMLDRDGEIDPLAPVTGMTIGDKEIIASLANSYLLRNDRFIDRFIKKNNFDRVFSVIVDPDDFEVDVDRTISENGLAGRIMINKLQEQNLLIETAVSDVTKKMLIPRDPAAGGFSIGNLSCQFSPNSSSSLKEETLTTSEMSGADPGGYVAVGPSKGLIKYGSDPTDLTSTLGGAFEKESASGDGSGSGGSSFPSSTSSTSTPA